MVKKSTPEGDVLFGYDEKERVTDIQAAEDNIRDRQECRREIVKMIFKKQVAKLR